MALGLSHALLAAPVKMTFVGVDGAQGFGYYLSPYSGTIEGRSEAAHTGSDGGMSMKASDFSCVPLCADCHRQAPGAYHRIGMRTFEQRHGLLMGSVVDRLQQEWRGKCA